MTRRPTPAAAPASPDRLELIAALAHKTATLKQRDAALLERQIALEQAGIRPTPPRSEPDPHAEALRMLNGYAPPRDEVGTQAEQLHAIVFERQALAHALNLLGRQDIQARAIALAELLRDFNLDWREIVAERARALLALRAANAKARRFRDMLAQKTGLEASLPCDRTFGIFASPPLVGDHAYNFLQSCVEFGAITQKEIKDAS
jgi:hypothetical protein